MFKFGWPEKYKLMEDFLWCKLSEQWELNDNDDFVDIVTFFKWFSKIDKLIKSNISNLDTLILQVMNTIIYSVEQNMINLLNLDIERSLGDDEKHMFYGI